MESFGRSYTCQWFNLSSACSLLILLAFFLIQLRLDYQHLLFLVSSTLCMLAHHFSFYGIDWSLNVTSLSILLLLLFLLLLVVIVLLLLLRCLGLLLLVLLMLLLLRCPLLIASLALVSPWSKVLVLKVVKIFLNINTLIVIVAVVIVRVVAFIFFGSWWIVWSHLSTGLTLLLFAKLFILVLCGRVEFLWTTIISLAHFLSHDLWESTIVSASRHDKSSLWLLILLHLSFLNHLFDVRAFECAFRVRLPLSKV